MIGSASPPIRARLTRILQPENERFPHDLLLYPTGEPAPERWETVWVKIGLYEQFLNQWDGQTCPACQTPTVQKQTEKKYTGDTPNGLYSSWVSYDVFTIYRCDNCRCGWTERTGSESFVDTSFP